MESAPVVRVFMDLAGNHVANPDNRVEIGNSLSHRRVPLKGPLNKAKESHAESQKSWKVGQNRESQGNSIGLWAALQQEQNPQSRRSGASGSSFECCESRSLVGDEDPNRNC